MFTLTYVDLEYENSISSCDIWNDNRTLLMDLLLFQLATRLNTQNRNETGFINGLWHINFYKNIGSSNWHNWSFDHTNTRFFTLFQFHTRLPTSKYLKIFGTYLVGRNGAIWNTCFSAPQNAKKENRLKHKTKCVTDFLLTVRSSSMKNYTCHYEVST